MAVILGFVPTSSPRTAELTLERMSKIMRLAAESPAVLEAAASIVSGVDGRDLAGQVAAVFSWVQRHTRFLRDPADEELLRSPTWMLDKIQHDGISPGDCDDVAMLAGTLARAIGFRVTLAAVGFAGINGPFQHVFAYVDTPAGPRHLDVQRPAGALPRVDRLITRTL